MAQNVKFILLHKSCPGKVKLAIMWKLCGIGYE